MKLSQLLVVAALAAFSSLAFGQSVRKEQVSFERGQSRIVFTDTIRSEDYIDYYVRAFAGQTLKVTLGPDSPSVNFNLLAPGAGDVAMFNGSLDGNKTSRVLPLSGEYRVRVYLMPRSDRGKQAKYSITLNLTGQGLARKTNEATIRGTHFHAQAKVPFRYSLNGSLRNADARVIRYNDNRSATVELRWSNGGLRRVLFLNGKPVASDSSESFSFTREGDDTVVRFGDGPSEEYVIPDAFLYGG